MLPPDYSGQLEIFDPSKFVEPVHIIGCGGIGSALFFPLLKLGVQTIHLWDKDAVEAHNIPCQLVYRPSDIGTSKVLAMKNFAERQEAECEVIPHDEFVTGETPLDGIVISGVDSQDSRKAIWAAIQANLAFVPLYMDGRLGGENLQLLTQGFNEETARLAAFSPADFDAALEYEEHWLFPSSRSTQLPCAARTVIHPPVALASLIIAQLTLYMRKVALRDNICFNLKTMQFVASEPKAEVVQQN
jgi:hypothetical protein